MAEASIDHAIDVALADERGDPLDRPLEERLVAEEREKGLRSLRAAEGPEPGPAATGEDHGVHEAAILDVPTARLRVSERVRAIGYHEYA
jgi:hypothetical protein